MAVELVYVLFDSKYASKKLVDACNAKGFHVIAAFKTNRTMYPAGVRIQVSDYANEYIRCTNLHSVTVEDRRYQIYEYEGQLSDIESVKVLLCWEGGFNSDKTPFCILSTDGALDVITVLRHYLVRWNIETGYQYFKDLLGFDQYQVQSFQAIERFWSIQCLVDAYLEPPVKQSEFHFDTGRCRTSHPQRVSGQHRLTSEHSKSNRSLKC
ncbi:transposase [Alicyclobacillus ferrooxydans]|uniref:transposase n=1 Tax=Alicyclobacillus ferrooxydans TaxID=471514 RepID=UPI00146FFBC3|nr:transposase [Alicyclobacillus ferrooxydans]